MREMLSIIIILCMNFLLTIKLLTSFLKKQKILLTIHYSLFYSYRGKLSSFSIMNENFLLMKLIMIQETSFNR
jgi:hypothetical protein